MLDYLANHCLNHALGCLRGHDLGEGETRRPGEQVAPFRRSAFAPARKHEHQQVKHLSRMRSGVHG